MCTVSVLRAPWADASLASEGMRWRVIVNRDEQRSRSAAEPPRLAACGPNVAAFPVDPDGGGTWVAASSAGLVFTLLNEPPHEPPREPRDPASQISRGLVIPGLLAARSLAEAAGLVRGLDIGQMAPFRLLAIGDWSGLEFVSAGRGLAIKPLAPSPRLLRTSSSVRTAEVRALRSALFAEMVPAASRRLQDAFHGHRWDVDRPASVLMDRDDARTVSQTVVEVFADHMRVEYRPVPAWTGARTVLARSA